MNTTQLQNFVDQHWEQSILPTLEKYIRIPNKSPAFDALWQEHGYMDQVFELVKNWCNAQNIKGIKVQEHRLPARTPLLLIEIPGQLNDKTVLLYGHLDKQPELSGWSEGLGPWTPVRQGDRLYGRGGADDGYAVFGALTAIKALQEQAIPHARCVILIEACEESGSYDLPFYVEKLQAQIGEPDLVVCLDSGCGNYEQLWVSTSLRGVLSGVLTIDILQEGVHSGSASGIIPSSFRILRQLLSRIDNENTGEISLDYLNVTIPEQRIHEAKQVANVLGDTVWSEFPLVKGAQPINKEGYELILNRTWRPALSIIGVDGIPSLENAGSVLRPRTSVMISIRVPPTCDVEMATQKLKQTLESNPPYHAMVSFTPAKASTGWHAPATQPWLQQAIQQASLNFYGKDALCWGEGGTIPFIGMLGEKFPNAQFVVTGVLGPHSNAHGPNEFLHILYAKRITSCVAFIISEHFKHNK